MGREVAVAISAPYPRGYIVPTASDSTVTSRVSADRLCRQNCRFTQDVSIIDNCSSDPCRTQQSCQRRCTDRIVPGQCGGSLETAKISMLIFEEIEGIASRVLPLEPFLPG
jgi:hypothetical protein